MLVLATHTIQSAPSATVPFAVILLQGAAVVVPAQVPLACCCGMHLCLHPFRAGGTERVMRVLAIPRVLAGSGITWVLAPRCHPPADHISNKKVPHDLKCRQLVPSSGAVSTSLWDVADKEALQQWLDEVRGCWHAVGNHLRCRSAGCMQLGAESARCWLAPAAASPPTRASRALLLTGVPAAAAAPAAAGRPSTWTSGTRCLTCRRSLPSAWQR